MSAESISPKKYTIPQQEFASPPHALKPVYVFGESPDRSVFTPLLIHNFGSSRGSIVYQSYYLQYLQARTGFDYKDAFRNYLRADGAHSLLDEEREAIVRVIRGVGGHHVSLRQAPEGQILYAFDKDVRRTIDDQGRLDEELKTLPPSAFLIEFRSRLAGARNRLRAAQMHWE